MSNESFIKYLDSINELIDLYKNLEFSSELMSELGLTEEQVDLANAFLKSLQEEWEKQFIRLLEFGINNIKKGNGDVE